MNRIDALFHALATEGRKALSAFITAGDPCLETSRAAMHALVEGGTNLLELGIPFSDPESDGATIQAASQRALAHPDPTRLTDVLALVARFRAADDSTPVLLMGYLNSLIAMGMEAFAQQARQAGVDGVILVNLPLEAHDEVLPAFEQAGLHSIFLVAPTTSESRARLIASRAGGFLYYVSIKGVTGASHIDIQDLARHMQPLRRITELPIQIGFGITTPEAARQVAPLADGLIVGSAFVNCMAGLVHTPEDIAPALQQKASAFRAAIDQASTSP